MSMIIPEFNQVSYGKKSLRTFGPKLWNSLPGHIKSSENLKSFKRTIKDVGIENVASVRFVIAVSKLIFRFNVDILGEGDPLPTILLK